MADADAIGTLNGSRPAPAGGVARLDEHGATAGSAGRAAERAQLKRLAQEFEALLLNEMLTGWRQSLLSEGETERNDGFGVGGLGTMTDMVGGEFGRALSRSGGLGIAETIIRAFERQQGTGAAPVPGPGAAALRPAPVAEVTSVPVQPVQPQPTTDGGPSAGRRMPEPVESAAATVTSPFGWRRDPFSGQARFHAGLDLRMAYGQEVASLAPGTVSAVAEQRGYGLTVVVDHPDGFQTRYAHLSSTDVQPGDKVERGQRLARAGSSGRSTGPHLHVELLSQGRPVDPGDLLKQARGDADWMAYRSESSEHSE